MESRVVPERLPRILYALLALEALSAFLSESRFIPDIRNNIGAFELTAIVLFTATFIYYFKYDLPLRFHPLFAVFFIWLFAAALSLFHYLSPRIDVGVISVLILIFQFGFIVALFNLLTLRHDLVLFVLRAFAIAIVIIGLMVLLDQITSRGSLDAAGPFRNRSGMGIYMMGAFWILLLYRLWPGTKPWEHWLTYPAMALVLYALAASLRQSVYVAMIVGGVGLALALLLASGWGRVKALTAILIGIVFVGLLFTYGGKYLTSLAIFNREFVALTPALGLSDEDDDTESEKRDFRVAQLRAAFIAMGDHPLLGIGWGAFYGYQYAPTRNEMHSTPLRFVAELGVTGLLLYVAFMSIIMLRAIRLLWYAWRTPYRLVAFVFLVGMISYATSHYYNRMFTDRPYWWFLVIFMASEVVILNLVTNAQAAAKSTVKPGLVAGARVGS